MAAREHLLCEWRPEAIVFGEVTVERRGRLMLNALVQVDSAAIAATGDVAAAVRNMVERQGWKDREVVVLYMAGRFEHHILDTPAGSSAETALLVEGQLKESLPEPLENYLYRTYTLAQSQLDGSPGARTFVAMAPFMELEGVVPVISFAGLRLGCLLTMPLALIASARARGSAGPDEVWVHLDHGQGTMIRFDARVPTACREFRYGSERSQGSALDPRAVANAVERTLTSVVEATGGRPVARLRITGWEASADVFDALVTAGHPVDVVTAPEFIADDAQLSPERKDAFVYAHAPLLWCALSRPPIDLTPRGVQRPKHVRGMLTMAAAMAAAFAVALGAGAASAARLRRTVESEIAEQVAEKDKMRIDGNLVTAHAEAQSRMTLTAQLFRYPPDLGGLLSAISLAAGARTTLTTFSVTRVGDEHRAEINGRAYGIDAAAAQADFERFANILRASKSVASLTVRELQLNTDETTGPHDVAVDFAVDLVVAAKGMPPK